MSKSIIPTNDTLHQLPTHTAPLSTDVRMTQSERILESQEETETQKFLTDCKTGSLGRRGIVADFKHNRFLKNSGIAHHSSESNFDIIPEHRVDNNGGKTILYLHDRILHAGPYSLTNGSAPLAIFSFNYNRKESALACYTIEEIEADIKKSGKLKMDALDLQGKEFKQAIMQISEGIRLWKWCILLALLFLAAEIALVRFWKK